MNKDHPDFWKTAQEYAKDLTKVWALTERTFPKDISFNVSRLIGGGYSCVVMGSGRCFSVPANSASSAIMIAILHYNGIKVPESLEESPDVR